MEEPKVSENLERSTDFFCYVRKHAVLSHRKPASAETSRYAFDVKGHRKKRAA